MTAPTASVSGVFPLRIFPRLFPCRMSVSLKTAVPLLALLVFVLSACESPRLPSVMQGSRVPVEAKTSADVDAEKDKPVVPQPQPAPQPSVPPPSPETGTGPSPSLVPYLTDRVPPDGQAAPGGQPPIIPMATSSTVRIALLVPLTGTNQLLGKAMLNAAQLALFDFSDDKFELLIHDTQGTPEGALEAARFAIGDGASIILGPLLGTSVTAIAPLARAANVSSAAASDSPRFEKKSASRPEASASDASSAR